MKTRTLVLLSVAASLFILGLGLFLVAGSLPASAQRGAEPGLPPSQPICPPGAPCEQESWLKPDQRPGMPLSAPQGFQPQSAGDAVAPASTGGPDDFGYTWDDTVAFNWIDATSGVDTRLSSSRYVTGPVAIGFPFKFYENAYSQIWISRYGMMGFTSSYGSGGDIPSPAQPNNLIAVYWSYLQMDPSSKIYYTYGGAAPNRYFVVEWQGVHDGFSDSSYTFEAILWENGDIQTQYQTMHASPSGWYCSSIGIEDSLGNSGLTYLRYCYGPQPPNNKAVRFSRPAPSARVGIFPRYQGELSQAGKVVAFQIPVRNTGEVGADTYDVAATSGWAVSLYSADGIFPLIDTNSDGIVDTGSVSQGGVVTITVKMSVPTGARVGDSSYGSVALRSSLNASKIKTVNLRVAVPAPFAQVYGENNGAAMTLSLIQPGFQINWTAPSANNSRGYPSVAETPDGNFVYAWGHENYSGSVWTAETRYTTVNRRGQTILPVTKLTDHSGASLTTYDYSPVVAVAPNGRIGVLWYQWQYRYAPDYQYLYNIYFAILDASGGIATPPTNVTNNGNWGSSANRSAPSFYSPSIVATGDNRFVLAWTRETYESAGYIDDIYITVRDGVGNQVQPITKLTNDTPGYDKGYSYPAMTPVSGNRVLVTFTQVGNRNDIYAAVLDSTGSVLQNMIGISGEGSSYYADAVQLSDGNILVAWTYGGSPSRSIRFAILDGGYNVISGPNTLSNPAALMGSTYVSVTADKAGHGILTWMDDLSYNPNLYYALVNSDGTVRTPAQIFRSAQSGGSIRSSYDGHGNTSYSWEVASGVDDAVTFGSALFPSPPGGSAALTVNVANNGLITSTGVLLTATLDVSLTYASDTSGVVPTIGGNTLVWSLADMSFMARSSFVLRVGVPVADIGARYPVTLTLGANEPDANPADNTTSGEVMVARQIFLPVQLKGR